MNPASCFSRACSSLMLLVLCMFSSTGRADIVPPGGIDKLGAGPALSGEIYFASTVLSSPVKLSAAVKNSGSAPSAQGETYVTFGGDLFRTEKILLPAIRPGQTQFLHFSTRHELPTSLATFLQDNWGEKSYQLHIVVGGADRIIAQQNITLNYSYNAYPHTAKSFSVRVPADTSPTPADLPNPALEKIKLPRSSIPETPAAKAPLSAAPTQTPASQAQETPRFEVQTSTNAPFSGIGDGSTPAVDTLESKHGVPVPPGVRLTRVPQKP